MRPITSAHVPERAAVPRQAPDGSKDPDSIFGALLDVTAPTTKGGEEQPATGKADVVRPPKWAALFPALGKLDEVEKPGEAEPALPGDDVLELAADEDTPPEPASGAWPIHVLPVDVVAKTASELPVQSVAAAAARSTPLTVAPDRAASPTAGKPVANIEAAEVAPLPQQQVERSSLAEPEPVEPGKPVLREVVAAEKHTLIAPAAMDADAQKAAPSPRFDPPASAESHSPELRTEPQVVPASSSPPSSPASPTPAPLPPAAGLALDPVAQPALVQAARRVTEADLAQLTPEKTTETLKLQLKPLDLGSVTAVLHSADGILSISLQVESAEAHHRLVHEKDAIGKAIRDLGFDLPSVTVQHIANTTQTTLRDGNPMPADGGGASSRGARDEFNHSGQSGHGPAQRGSDEGKKSRASVASLADDRLQPGRYI